MPGAAAALAEPARRASSLFMPTPRDSASPRKRVSAEMGGSGGDAAQHGVCGGDDDAGPSTKSPRLGERSADVEGDKENVGPALLRRGEPRREVLRRNAAHAGNTASPPPSHSAASSRSAAVSTTAAVAPTAAVSWPADLDQKSTEELRSLLQSSLENKDKVMETLMEIMEGGPAAFGADPAFLKMQR